MIDTKNDEKGRMTFQEMENVSNVNGEILQSD